uniref:Uncharacterized protein n=2 Tax=Parascaris univalens TaxID=6257 RepID=A0A914ZWL3_PARUN
MMSMHNLSVRELKAALDQLLCAVIIVSVIVAILLVEQCSIMLYKFVSRRNDASERAVHGSSSQIIRSKKEKKRSCKRKLERSQASVTNAVEGTTDRSKVIVEEMLGDISESPEELSSTMPERVYTRINRKILIRLPEEDDERSQKVIKIKASQWPSLVTASKGWTGCAQHEAAVVPAHRSSSASNTSPTNIDVDAVDPTQDEISPLRRAERSDEEISATTPREMNEMEKCTIHNDGERHENTAAS